MLAIRGVEKVYPSGTAALRGIDLDIGKGVFGLLGPNGAGKSTLMEILSAGLEFERGTILLNGKLDLARSPMAWRRNIGYLPQAFDFPACATGRELMEEAGLLLSLPRRALAERTAALLEKVNLSWAADRYAAQYSRGMKQRLGIAMALLHDPPLLLFDEPTAGLDPVERALFRELLVSLSPHHAIILSTHIVPDVERCCDHIGVIDAGRVVYTGTGRELAARADGRVWEVPLSAAELEQESARRRMVGISRRGDEMIGRVVAENPPAPRAVPAAATLDDAYFHLLGGRV